MTSPGNTSSVGNGADNDRSSPSQQASGGSGGAQLTQSNGETRADLQPGKPETGDASNDTDDTDDTNDANDATSDATASNRTAQDTRANQAGSTGTGLGAAEAGGSEDPFVMPKE